MISPMMGVMRFIRKGKLSQNYVGLYEIIQSVGQVAYELALCENLASVHHSFMYLCQKSSFVIQ